MPKANTTAPIPEDLHEGVTVNQLRLAYNVTDRMVNRLIAEFGIESIGRATGHGKKNAVTYSLPRIGMILSIYKSLMRRGRKADDVIAQIRPLIESLDDGKLSLYEEEHMTSRHPDTYKDPGERSKYIKGTSDLVKLGKDVGHLIPVTQFNMALSEVCNVLRLTLQGLPDNLEARGVTSDSMVIDAINDATIDISKQAIKDLEALHEQHTVSD